MTRSLAAAAVALAIGACTRRAPDPPAPPTSTSTATATPTPAGDGVRITGVTGMAIHEHGGESAHVRHATFLAINADASPHQLELVRVDFLADSGTPCDAPAVEFLRTLRFEGMHLSGAGGDGGAAPVRVATLPAGARVDVDVVLAEPADAYQASCSRFGFRADFLVDGARRTAVANLQVTRISPPPRPAAP